MRSPASLLDELNGQAHLLRHVSADEAPDGVILPAGRFADLGHRRPLFLAQEFEDNRLLGPARASSLPAEGGADGSSIALPFLSKSKGIHPNP